ncbi:MAG: glycosyltransferase [Nocardioidaceae bacterium]|nr:glycosyltransferase [Nocardioidaceae bacterium]
MRVALAAESFLPRANRVTTAVLHVSRQLQCRGHEVLILAPGPGPTRHHDARVVRIRAVRLPTYAGLPVGLPDPALRRSLEEFRPDLVHLASPVALGAAALRAARQLHLPTVGVFQTDVSGFLRHYGAGATGRVVDRWLGSLHQAMDLTLTPSHAGRVYLEDLGVAPVRRWLPGVAGDRYGSDPGEPTEVGKGVVRTWEVAVRELVDEHYASVVGARTRRVA